MPSVLAATLISNNANRNEAKPGDTISFRFSSPPTAAKNVEILVQQGKFKKDGAVERVRPLARFRGSIVGKQYKPATATNLTGRVNKHAARIILSDGTNQLTVPLIDTFRAVIRNELQVTVTGSVGGAKETFAGREPFFVKFPLVMIIPTRPARRDPSLNVVADWARRQWQPHDPSSRSLQTVQTIRSPNRGPLPADYDTLIAAFQGAVAAAAGGIIALAIGHGDGGEGSSQNLAWCDLMPEDERLREVNGRTLVPHTLFIQDEALGDGAVKGQFPQGNNLVLLNTLDRIADVLATAATPVRKLLLHTCKAGASEIFIQRFADRVQVPVQAHTETIEYDGFLDKGSINAHYKGEANTASGAFDWPLGQAAIEKLPGPAPKRFPLTT